MRPTEVKYADLFCGLGAFHTAFDRCSNSKVKYTCVFACDTDSGVRGVYEENYGLAPHGDIRSLAYDELPDFDILCAGFPCQPFSIAGSRRGFADEDKGNLFYSVLDVVDAKQPDTLLLENVKNLCTIHGGSTFATIKQELQKRGYHVVHKVIDSRHCGSPQSRRRVYIVCTKTQPYEFQIAKRPIVPVSSIIDGSVDSFCEYRDKYHLRPCTGGGMMKHTLVNKLTGRGGRQGERVYGIDTCGATVCASGGGVGAKTGLYEVGEGLIRTLTVGETLLMFGFDSSFQYESLGENKKRMLYYLGNSIVVDVLVDVVSGLVK